MRASSSTRPPRATLTRYAPRFHGTEGGAVDHVDRLGREGKRTDDVVGVGRAPPRHAFPTTILVTPVGLPGLGRRVHARTSTPNGSSIAATRVLTAPRPRRSTTAPVSSANGSPTSHRPASDCRTKRGSALAADKMARTTHSAMGRAAIPAPLESKIPRVSQLFQG